MITNQTVLQAAEDGKNVFVGGDVYSNAGCYDYDKGQNSEGRGGYDAYGSILLGLNIPINDLSRGCNAEEVYATAIITAALS